MNCETFTRFDTSSLYKNGRLIAEASAVFLVRRCQNVDLAISYQTYCRCCNRMLRVYFKVDNTGDTVINNARLVVKVASTCYGCESRNFKCFNICNLTPNNEYIYYIDLPFPCNKHYLIKGIIAQNNILLEEECKVI